MLRTRLRTMWYHTAKWMCRIFCMVLFRMRVSGRENIPKSGAFVLVSNHQSYLDPMLCGAFLKRPVVFLARESLFRHWFFGRAIASVDVVPLKLNQADMGTMRKVIKKLREGRGVCLFPEGTRCLDGRIGAIKPGFGLLCRRGKAGVVPVVIEGAFECWPRGQKIFSPGKRIWVRYGEAITAEQAKEMGDVKLGEVVTERLRQMQNDLRTEHGREPHRYEV